MIRLAHATPHAEKIHNSRKTILSAAGALLIALAPSLSFGQEKLVSERGAVPINKTTLPEHYRIEKDQQIIPRTFEQQPPLIPHTVKGYNITQNFNKCMDCHSSERAKETKATKVGASHYETREGAKLPNISPRRYFCMQCHVPQFDAKPLVENTFKPAPKKAQ